MSRRCELTGKRVMVGHNISHAHNVTKRVYRPNLCRVTVTSDTLDRRFKLRISAHALRSIDHVGGLDAFLLKSRNVDLSPRARRIKVEVERARSPEAAEVAAATAATA